jgi:polysaccharide biosynthesis protein PelA
MDLGRGLARLIKGGLAVMLCFIAGAVASGTAVPLAPVAGSGNAFSIAFHYGKRVSLDAFRAFDVVVVDPDHGHDPKAYKAHPEQRSELFAYVALGEVHPDRGYAGAIAPGWLIGQNKDWHSRIIDQTQSRWPAFVMQQIVEPLWQKGYRGLFLDTLDSWQLLDADKTDKSAQAQALGALILQIKRQYPEMQLIANRGFELLPQIAPALKAVAAESVLQGWQPKAQAYLPVAADDRQWLLKKFSEIRQQYKLPVVAIDYVAPQDRDLTRKTAQALQQLGLIAWVSDYAMQTLGIGEFEVLPKKVVVLHDASQPQHPAQTEPFMYLMLPLQHLGYQVEVKPITDATLAEPVLADTVQGVVVWSRSEHQAMTKLGARWFKQLQQQQIPVAFLQGFGTAPDSHWQSLLGLRASRFQAMAKPVKSEALAWVGFETVLAAQATWPLALATPRNHRPALSLRDANGQVAQPVAITSWGGYALAPYVTESVPGSDQARWVIDPLEFLKLALRLPDIPAPDLTTELGRRILTIHIDGDGFASRAELPGAPLASEVMAQQFIKRYRLPHTVSVIEAEVSGQGLFKQLAPAMKSVAKKIFALPHVEIASHSFSHPFKWQDAVAGANNRDGVALLVPGYQFDLRREIEGSTAFIDLELAPAGKKTKVFLWTGDCLPPQSALQAVSKAGLLAMNGGDTMISRDYPSISAVSPHYVAVGDQIQVTAPVQSEMLYTNLWQGPFSGYRRVIETFEMTEKPHRLKPVGIYYHTYSASKPASIAALKEVYDWAVSQPLYPMFVSTFIQKVRDFDATYIARAVAQPASHIRITNRGALQTVRWHAGATKATNWHRSDGVFGTSTDASHADQAVSYLHGQGGRMDWFSQNGGTSGVYVANTDARIERFVRTKDSLELTLSGQGTHQVAFGNLKPHCALRVNDRHFENPALSPLTLEFSGTHEQPGQHLVSIHCGA